MPSIPSLPDPTDRHPVPGHPRVAFLKPLLDAENIEVGEFTYYDDPDGPEHFRERCVLHHYPSVGDRLVIGRYTAIAAGVTFIMNGANHALDGFSTYPFPIFGGDWAARTPPDLFEGNSRGDTVVGNDVWIGHRATILPGTRIGDGAVIGALAVVGSDVPPYAVVVGNPGRVVRIRFTPDTVRRLLAVAWWDWPADAVARHLPAIVGCDIGALEAASQEEGR
jgi:virginiamycin A acetyltransferase